jgi:hypothetical protein
MLSRLILALLLIPYALPTSLLLAADGDTVKPELIPDFRHVRNGLPIPGGVYCDQPYLTKLTDGTWLCCMTTAQGREGSATQTVVVMRSADRGKSWSKPLPLEKPGGPEASYGVLLQVPMGRVYCFYNYNTKNLREVKTETGGVFKRVDSQGDYVFRFSDDGGKTWSSDRTVVPVREFEVDRKNVYKGEVRFFWNVGRPLLITGDSAKRKHWPGGEGALLTLHKVGAMGTGFFAQSEGALLRSNNILTEKDVRKITFTTLPEGDIGLRTPAGGGRIAEEQSIVQLTDGSIYCVYRSIDGHPVCCISRDGGKTWSKPEYKTFTPEGRRMKHPRAANFVWDIGKGRYLYWFHNHAPTTKARAATWDPYADRNPAWLCAGREIDTPNGKRLAWSEPEILLYDDDPYVRMSYPDLLEDDGEFYLTETQKAIGRVHRLDRGLLQGLLTQHENKTLTTKGLVLNLPPKGGPMPAEVAMPKLSPLRTRDLAHEDGRSKDLRGGFTLDFQVNVASLDKAIPLAKSMQEGTGFELTAQKDGSIRLHLNDGQTEVNWASDAGVLKVNQPTHVCAIVDGGPKLILFVVNGQLCDGGEQRQFGWGRFSEHYRGLSSGVAMQIGKEVSSFRVYNRALRVSEAVGNHRAVSGR